MVYLDQIYQALLLNQERTLLPSLNQERTLLNYYHYFVS